MLISIIIVSFQTGPVLFEALASVLEQKTRLEICLVDNGNPTDVVEAIRALARGEPRLRLITGHGNVGFSRACNLGAREASGDFLLFLNPDSRLKPDALSILCSHSTTLKSPYMIGARLIDEDGTDQRGCRRALLTPRTALIEATRLYFLFPTARLNFNKEPLPQTLTVIPAISGAFMFLPAHDFWHLDGFDEGYFLHVEDLDFCLRFRRKGGEIYFAPDVVVTHIGATSDATTAFIERHKARGFIRYFHKNYGADYPAPFLWLLDLAVWARAWVKIVRN